MTADPRSLELAIQRNLLVRTTRAYEDQITQLHEEKELAQITLASIADAVLTTDARQQIRFLNPAAEDLTGWGGLEARGHHLNEILRLFDEDGEEPLILDLTPALELGEPVRLGDHTSLLRRDGQGFAVEGKVSPIRDRKGGTIGLVLVIQDVSEKQLLSLQLTRAANYDGLTGLLNREAFDHHLLEALRRVHESGTHHVFCYLDVDRFKFVNDSCGHQAGDLLLQWISSLVRERIRDSDVLARLGGDEFGLLLHRCTSSDAMRIAKELQDALKAFRFVWQDQSFVIGVSIGLVPLSPEFRTLPDVFGAADQAVYSAKEQGGRRIQVYHQENEEIAYRHGQVNWVLKIQTALDQDEFALHWQRIEPIGRDHSRRPCFEILLRLRDRAGSLHSPVEFLPAAERYGLMPSIDRWVVARTIRALAEQPSAFLDQIDWCSINLSGASLGDEGLTDFIEETLAASDLDPRKICFEITETAAVANFGKAVRMIERLSQRRCRWALDDFGSGMSSFGYLRELPVDFIKIDGNIVSDLINSALSRAMVRSINQIGHVLGVATIAETVTSAAMLEELRDMGVDYAQGFWVERPRPLESPASVQPLSLSGTIHE